MYKIIATTFMVITCCSLQAQSLMDMFKAMTTTTTTETTPTETTVALSHEALLGDWSFQKLSVGLSDNSSLKGFAGDVAVSQFENRVNSLSSSMGVTANMFTATIKKKRVELLYNETTYKCDYSVDESNSTISVSIGDIDNVEIEDLKADITLYEDSIVVLFNAKELMVITDNLPELEENTQFQMVKSVINSVDGLLLGVTMSKI